MTTPPPEWSETPPSEPGYYWLQRECVGGKTEAIPAHFDKVWNLLWYQDPHSHEEVTDEWGYRVGPRITLDHPPALRWVDLETAKTFPPTANFVYRWNEDGKERLVLWQAIKFGVPDWTNAGWTEEVFVFLRLDGGQV